MKKFLFVFFAVIVATAAIACPILYALTGPAIGQGERTTFGILLIVLFVSILYCFVVGEVTGNNSQMDKLWSILPEVYCWIIAVRGGMKPRLVVMAVLATVWGARLTVNFARKGAYKLKFWEGEEDYRWKYLRQRKPFSHRAVWTLFDFFFISIYQNVLVFLTTLPALVAMNSDVPFGWLDAVAAVLTLGFIALEAIADEQQWKFQQTKYKMLAKDRTKTFADLPDPYSLGFNTVGLWNRARHPNYLGEQGTWIAFYLFSVAAGVGIFQLVGVRRSSARPSLPRQFHPCREDQFFQISSLRRLQSQNFPLYPVEEIQIILRACHSPTAHRRGFFINSEKLLQTYQKVLSFFREI